MSPQYYPAAFNHPRRAHQVFLEIHGVKKEKKKKRGSKQSSKFED
jgi:hypothetical protein